MKRGHTSFLNTCDPFFASWDPGAVGPILEHYLQTDLATLSKEFDAWCHYLAYEEFDRQWASR